jgi:hypothetical protein
MGGESKREIESHYFSKLSNLESEVMMGLVGKERSSFPEVSRRVDLRHRSGERGGCGDYLEN